MSVEGRGRRSEGRGCGMRGYVGEMKSEGGGLGKVISDEK